MFNRKIHYKWPFSIALLVHQRVCLWEKRGSWVSPAGSSLKSSYQELGHDVSFFWVKHPVVRAVKSLRTGPGNSLLFNICEIPKSLFLAIQVVFFLLFYLHHEFFSAPQCCHGKRSLPTTAPALARIVPKRTSTGRTCSPLLGDGIHHSLQGIS